MYFQASQEVKIPKEHHRFILGPKGKRLSELELATATKISIPRLDEASDTITISGTKEGIERARHEIQLISDEQVCLYFGICESCLEDKISGISQIQVVFEFTMASFTITDKLFTVKEPHQHKDFCLKM
jgi:rRNA processing protein Krr1/Pno1